MTASELTRSWKLGLFIAAGVVCSAAVAAASAASEPSESTADAQATEQAVFLLVDRSPSMLAQPDPSLAGLLARDSNAASIAFTKWEHLVDVVGSVGKAPRESGQRLSLSLGFFPEATSCDAPSELASPVAADTLPAAQSALEPALVRAGSGYAAATSLLGAIESGAEFCHELSVRKPGAACSILLITDGGGDTCDSAHSDKAVARVKQLQAAGVSTQILALSGANLPILESIAQAGTSALAAGKLAVAVPDSPRGLRSALTHALRERPAPVGPHKGWAGVARNDF